MIDPEKAFHQAFVDLAAEASRDAERVEATALRALRRRTRRVRTLFGVAGASAAIIVYAAVSVGDSGASRAGGATSGNSQISGVGGHHAQMSSRQTIDPYGDFNPLPVKPGEPCPFAQEMSLSELASRAPEPIWMPDSRQASEDSLTAAWFCGGDATLTFDSGVTVTYEGGWGGVEDVKEYWAKLIQQRGAGEVGTVLGQPALLGAASASYPPGEVFVVADGDTLIYVTGNGKLAEDDLVEVANSIDISNPIPPK